MMMAQLEKNFGKTKKRGEIIFCEFEPGSTIFFIQAGHVNISKIIGDKEKTLAIIGPGDIFGEMAILESAPRSATAVAEEDVRLLEFDKNNFAQLVNAQPAIAVKLLKLFALRIHDQKRKYKIISLPDSETKIMDVFVMLAENKKLDIEKVREIDLEITIENVANWAGITFDDCQKTLKTMERSNKILVSSGYIKVLNLYQLSRHINSKRQYMERESD